jgi:hypothetical protein
MGGPLHQLRPRPLPGSLGGHLDILLDHRP